MQYDRQEEIQMEIEKSARLLYLYQDFVKGVGVQKKAAADHFGVNERSLQRDSAL